MKLMDFNFTSMRKYLRAIKVKFWTCSVKLDASVKLNTKNTKPELYSYKLVSTQRMDFVYGIKARGLRLRKFHSVKVKIRSPFI